MVAGGGELRPEVSLFVNVGEVGDEIASFWECF